MVKRRLTEEQWMAGNPQMGEEEDNHPADTSSKADLFASNICEIKTVII